MIGTRMHDTSINRRKAMVRYALAALAAVVLVGASLIPRTRSARRGGGGGYRGGGFHGGGVHAGRVGVGGRGYAGRGYAGRGYAGRGYAGRGYGYRDRISSGSAHGGPQRCLRSPPQSAPRQREPTAITAAAATATTTPTAPGSARVSTDTNRISARMDGGLAPMPAAVPARKIGDVAGPIAGRIHPLECRK